MDTIFCKKILAKVAFMSALCLVLLACKTKKMDTDKTSESPLLANCWTHSYEEEAQDGLKVFRPCDYKTFPPSRYRNTFTLNADKTCNASVLAANDGHYSEKGSWTFDADNKILKINNGQLVTYKVVEIMTDKLVVKLN